MSDTPLDVVGNEWQRTYRKQAKRIKELEAELAGKDKCLSEMEDEIIRLQSIIDRRY